MRQGSVMHGSKLCTVCFLRSQTFETKLQLMSIQTLLQRQDLREITSEATEVTEVAVGHFQFEGFQNDHKMLHHSWRVNLVSAFLGDMPLPPCKLPASPCLSPAQTEGHFSSQPRYLEIGHMSFTVPGLGVHA